MLFALPGYQFPYTVMNKCLYLTYTFNSWTRLANGPKQVPLIVLVHSLHEDLGEDPGSWTQVNPTLISDLISVDYSQPH